MVILKIKFDDGQVLYRTSLKMDKIIERLIARNGYTFIIEPVVEVDSFKEADAYIAKCCTPIDNNDSLAVEFIKASQSVESLTVRVAQLTRENRRLEVANDDLMERKVLAPSQARMITKALKILSKYEESEDGH